LAFILGGLGYFKFKYLTFRCTCSFKVETARLFRAAVLWNHQWCHITLPTFT